MSENYKALSSANPDEILAGIDEIWQELKGDPVPDRLELMFDALCSLFYIDVFDRPELAEVLNSAQRTVAAMGKAAIPLILERLPNADIRAELVFAQTCGLMGEDVIDDLLEYYDEKTDSTSRAFILYAFGKIKSPRIVTTLPLVLQAIKSPTRKLEDTAVRALGKICECINPNDVKLTVREEMFNLLINKIPHPNDVIRSKAVRSLGKMVRYGFTNAQQNNRVRAEINAILGLDDDHYLDPAYLVRREAQEILQYLD